MINRRAFNAALLAAAAGVTARPAVAADKMLRVGFILPMTGPFAGTGRQVQAAIKLYLAQHGNAVAGRQIEILLRDDTGTAPEMTKRLAEELVTNDNAEIIAGFGLTPLALAAAPVATAAKVPMIVTCAGTEIIPRRSPMILRTSFTLPQQSAPMALWAARNGIKTVVTLVADYAPGKDAETTFVKVFQAHGGKVLDSIRVPLLNPDFSPFVQRAKDEKPGAVFAFCPVDQAAALMKQFGDRGLVKAGIKLIGTGDITDDYTLDGMGDAALGTITAHFYSAAHPSPENQAYVAGFAKANPGMRPNFMSVGGYDGMALIYRTLRKTGGKTGPDFVAAAKGETWVSPRGPMTIDPATRDIIQDVYIRRVERRGGQLYNIEFAKFAQVKPDGSVTGSGE